jgi:hypothetical protein
MSEYVSAGRRALGIPVVRLWCVWHESQHPADVFFQSRLWDSFHSPDQPQPIVPKENH